MASCIHGRYPPALSLTIRPGPAAGAAYTEDSGAEGNGEFTIGAEYMIMIHPELSDQGNSKG